MANNCAQCSKLVIIFINFSLMICGLSLIILGALFLVDLKATQVLNISTLDTSTRVVHSTAVAMVGIGIGVLIISLLGCVAAIKENRLLLTAYCGFNIFIMFMELILCIMVVASIDDILREVENTMNITVQTQYGQPGYELETDAWDTLQTQLHCCGSNSTKDWQTSLWIKNETYRVVPDSCCVPQGDVINGTANTTECQEAVQASQYNSSAVYWTGCEARTTVWVHDHKTTLLSITTFATLFQFAVVVFSLCMCRNVRNRYDQFA